MTMLRFSRKKYPVSWKVLMSADPSRKVLAENADIPEPLFRGAEVKFEYDVVQEPGANPQFMVDRDSVELKLPEITAQQAEALPQTFALSTTQEVQDVFGRQGMINFKFKVSIQDIEKKENGMARLKFDAAVEEITDVTKA